jgi:hypothetical protein
LFFQFCGFKSLADFFFSFFEFTKITNLSKIFPFFFVATVQKSHPPPAPKTLSSSSLGDFVCVVPKQQLSCDTEQ